MSAPAASYRKPLIGFSIFAIVALLVTYTIYSTLERSVDGPTSSFVTTFGDAAGLRSGDDVRMAGVRVGRVESVSLDHGRAQVRFIVAKSQKIYAATRAAIRYQNLVGQRYLALSLVDGKPRTVIHPGSTLPLAGEDSFDVTRLLAGFQPIFDTLAPDQVNALSQGLVQAFDGDDISLSYTIAQLGKFAGDMAGRDQVLGAVITNLSQLMSEMAGQQDSISSTLLSLQKAITTLDDNSAAFGRGVSDIGQAASGMGDLLARLRPGLVSASSTLASATRGLVGDGAALDTIATDLPTFLLSLPRVMGTGAYLSLYICDLDISIGNVLLPPGIINKIGGTAHSAVCR